MSETKRLNIDSEVPRSISGIGLTRNESVLFESMADPSEFINAATSTDGYNALSDDEKAISLQLITDQFLDDATAQVFNTDNGAFGDLRHRIRIGQ